MSSLSKDLTNAPPEVLAMLAFVPALPPPSDITPNFIDPYTRAPIQVAVTSIMLALAVLFFLNRVYVKLCLTKKLYWDDATIVLAMLGTVAYYVASTWSAQRGGIGKHQWDISVVQAKKLDLLVPVWMLTVFPPPIFLFLKNTFFILYLSLFKQLRWVRFCAWFGIIATTLIYTTLTICFFIWATPPKHVTWFAHQTSPGVKKAFQASTPYASIGLVIDLYILIIPIIGVSGLQLSPKRKLGVLLIFLSGAMACICSACSIYYRVALERTKDSSYANAPVVITTLCEMFVGVICACIPSAAYAARQEHSVYRRTLRTVTSLQLSWAASRNGSTSCSQEVTESHPAPDALQSTDRKYARYFSVDERTNASSMDSKSSGENNDPFGSVEAV